MRHEFGILMPHPSSLVLADGETPVLSEYWPHLAVSATVLNTVLLAIFLPWILLSKKEPTATVAWCLLVLLLPVGGSLLFWVFGHNYLLHRVRHQRSGHHSPRKHPPSSEEISLKEGDEADKLDVLAERVGAYPARDGNAVTVYHETERAFEDLLDAISAAQHHIHLEYFILRSDATGQRFVDVLTRKAKEGVTVRLLYDAMGCFHLKSGLLRPLHEAGGKVVPFLPLNPLHSLIRINLRNHRKITVVDGRVGFTGGMNIGDEYLGKSPKMGYWRDAFVRIEGPAVGDLQSVFREDWEFAQHERLEDAGFFPTVEAAGTTRVQIADSGPDQEISTIREIYFLAIVGARRRLWIASPYLIPDAGLFDVLRVACYHGVDVRILTLLRPDHYVSYYAGLYYASQLLDLGVKIYLYRKGMMHAKLMMTDGRWGMVGSANLDNRSLHLNFEVGCALLDRPQVEQLEAAYRRDLDDAVPLNRHLLAQRSLMSRVLENACRLLTPTL
jgi:cardiolipin synthase